MAVFRRQKTATVAPAKRETRPGPAPGDEALTALAKLAPRRELAAGEVLVAADAADGTVYVVVDGRLAIGEGDAAAPLARGDMLRVPASAGALGAAIVARVASSVLELSPELQARLPITLQGNLWRAVAASTTTALQHVLAGRQRVAAAARALRQRAQATVERDARLVAVEPMQRAIAAIPALPAYAVDLAGKLLAPDARVNEIVESIRSDPALAALVLKTVNSSYFGLRTKVSDYYRAFLLLGANNVYRLVLDGGLRTLMPDTPDGRAIQSRSYLVSTIASELAVQTRRVEPQLATTVGLLHDIGASVAPAMAKAAPAVAAFVDGLDTAELGAALLAAWGLPQRVPAIIRARRLPEFTPPAELPADEAGSIAVLYLARLAAERLLGESEGGTSATYADEHVVAVGLRDHTFATLVEDVVRPALTRLARQLPAHLQERLARYDESAVPAE